MRADGVRTVVWVTPWVNLDSRDGQIPPQPESERLHREPAPNYAPGAAAGHFVTRAGRRAVRHPVVDGHRLAGRLHQPCGRGVVAGAGEAGAGAGRRGYQGRRRRGLLPPRAGAARRRAHRRRGGVGARRAAPRVPPARARRGPSRARACCSGAAAGPVSTRSATPGPAIRRRISGRCACSWSRRCRPRAAASRTGRTTSAATWAPAGRALPAGAARALAPVRLLHPADARPRPDAAGAVDTTPSACSTCTAPTCCCTSSSCPYVRAAAATAARTGLPIIRPLCLTDPADPRGWAIGDAYGYGPALWVAPVLEDEAREREVALPRGDWIETWSGAAVRGGGETVVDAPLERIPVWVRAGSIVVTYPASHVARGLGDVASPSGRWWPRCGASRGSVARRRGSPTARGSVAARTVVGVGVGVGRARGLVPRDLVAIGPGRETQGGLAFLGHPWATEPPTRVRARAPASAPRAAASAIESPRPRPSVKAAANESPQP